MHGTLRSPFMVVHVKVWERIMLGLELVEQITEKFKIIRQHLLTAQSRQESYADKRCRLLEFEVGDHVFLKTKPRYGITRFDSKGNVSPRYIGPFEILLQVGNVSYRLALPQKMSHVYNGFHVSML